MLLIKSNSSSQIGQYVPLKSISINSKIRLFGADVIITQIYRNDEKQPIEAVYSFPIEENAAIYSFIAKIDDREICAQLKEKQQAQEDYTQALEQGHGAYLMEQNEKSQDIFIINIGSLLPGKTCQIEIKYVSELTLTNGNKICFVVPTTIAPRYDPSIGNIQSKSKYVQSVPYTIDFRCQIDRLNHQQIANVSSSSHPINIQLKQNYYEINFIQKHTCLDRDIILDIHLLNQQNTILAIEKYNQNHLAIMTSFIFTKEDCQKVLNKNNNIINNEFIFIVDCSGSMNEENKINLARQAMILFLKSLPMNCQFNIVRFGSKYQTLFRQITEQYNEINVKHAQQFIRSMSADLGGTELLEPLEWLNTQPPSTNHSRQIFLLTDGEISNVTEVMDLCRTMSISSRIFSFGLGRSPSRALIKGLARTTNGRFTFIPPNTNVDIYVAEQLEKALEPCITNTKIKWNILTKFQSAPTVIPPIYANDRILIYAFIENQQLNSSITVELWNQEETARLGYGTVDSISKIIDSDDNNNNNQLIAHLAAKALIQEITHDKNRSSQLQQKQLLDISLKYHILCPHTAFIGIEKRLNSSNRNMILREVPIQISADDKPICLPSNSVSSSSVRSHYNTVSAAIQNYIHIPSQRHSSYSHSPHKINNVNTWPTHNQDIVRHLIDLQKFDGLWNLTDDDIQHLCQKSLTSFHSNLTYDSMLITTAIVIVMLKTKFKSYKIMWVFVVNKARQRLIELLNNNENNFKQLINDIKTQL